MDCAVLSSRLHSKATLFCLSTGRLTQVFPGHPMVSPEQEAFYQRCLEMETKTIQEGIKMQ